MNFKLTSYGIFLIAALLSSVNCKSEHSSETAEVAVPPSTNHHGTHYQNSQGLDHEITSALKSQQPETAASALKEYIKFVTSDFNPHASYSPLYFSTLLENFVTSGSDKLLGDYLSIDSGISNLEITKYLNFLATWDRSYILFKAVTNYPVQMNSFAPYIVIDSISPFLFNSMLKGISGNDLSQVTGLLAVAKEYFKRATGSKHKFSEIFDKNGVYHQEKLSAESIFEQPALPHTNLGFFVNDLEKDIFLNGSYIDIKHYLSLGIMPLKFVNSRDGLKCDNMMIDLLYKNPVLPAEDKLKLLEKLLYKNPVVSAEDKLKLPKKFFNRVDVNLPNTCYFSNIDEKGISPAYLFFEDLINKSETTKISKAQWRDFALGLKPNNKDTYKHAMKKLEEQYSKKMTVEDISRDNACKAVEMQQLYNLSGKNEFCERIRKCKDLTTEIQINDNSSITLLHAATNFCDLQSFRRHAINRVLAISHRPPHSYKDGNELFNDVVLFCLRKAEDHHALPPQCDLLQEKSTVGDYTFNIYDSTVGKSMLKNSNINDLIELGFDYTMLFTGHSVGNRLEIFNENVMSFFEIPNLLYIFAGQPLGMPYEVLSWILKRILGPNNEVNMKVYNAFTELLDNFVEKNNLKCKDTSIDTSNKLRHLLCAYSSHIPDYIIALRTFKTTLDNIHNKVQTNETILDF